MLVVLLFVPFGVALSVALLGVTRAWAIALALAGSLLTLGLASALYLQYRGAPLGQSFDVNTPWITALNINFHLGVDGMSVLFILLTAIITPVAVLVVAYTQRERVQSYLALLIFLEFALIGVFLALDLVLFYFFWEAVLIPAYFMIGVYGGDRRIYAAFKYVLYTMIGSLLMLVGILALFAQSHTGSFDLLTLMQKGNLLSPDAQRPVFLAFALAFGIKSAVFPFHSWVPDVYTESNAPTAVILSGVVSKMGIYGFLRFCLPLFPSASRYYGPAIMVLAVIGIIYGGLLALNQRDMRRLVACSSIAHLGFIALGIFSLTMQGVQGATLQAVNHGVTIAALFAIVAVVIERWGIADLEQLGGLAARAPIIAAIFLLITLSALGLPGLNGFAGEFLILLGTFQANAADSTVGTIGVVVAAAYMLRLFQGAMHGPLAPAIAAAEPGAPPRSAFSWFTALSPAQYAALVPLLVLIVWIGVYPAGWLNPTLSFAQSVIQSVGGQP
jgi:NADH-quinone oxidoreductase subunit M